MAADPGDRYLAVQEEHADSTGGATRIAFFLDGETIPGLTFFTLDDRGAIASFVELWPRPYEPPAAREHLVERY